MIGWLIMMWAAWCKVACFGGESSLFTQLYPVIAQYEKLTNPNFCPAIVQHEMIVIDNVRIWATQVLSNIKTQVSPLAGSINCRVEQGAACYLLLSPSSQF